MSGYAIGKRGEQYTTAWYIQPSFVPCAYAQKRNFFSGQLKQPQCITRDTEVFKSIVIVRESIAIVCGD